MLRVLNYVIAITYYILTTKLDHLLRFSSMLPSNTGSFIVVHYVTYENTLLGNLQSGKEPQLEVINEPNLLCIKDCLPCLPSNVWLR